MDENKPINQEIKDKEQNPEFVNDSESEDVPAVPIDGTAEAFRLKITGAFRPKKFISGSRDPEAIQYIRIPEHCL